MKILKITENLRKDLTERGIVICTYIDTAGDQFDGIDINFSSEYPDLEKIEISQINQFFI